MAPVFPYFGFPNYRYRSHNMNYNASFSNKFADFPKDFPGSFKKTTLNNSTTYKNSNINHDCTAKVNTYNSNNSTNNSFSNNSNNNCSSTNSNDDEQFINIFGFKIALDDILILFLLFFLYTEDVKDNYLYVVLIMLLLS